MKDEGRRNFLYFLMGANTLHLLLLVSVFVVLDCFMRVDAASCFPCDAGTFSNGATSE
mgnify:CR=1 FL=1